MPCCERCCHASPRCLTPCVLPVVPQPMRPRLQQFRLDPSISFGVELELCFPEGVRKGHVKKAMDAAAGHRGWRLVKDDSIKCNISCSSMEVNTPVLQGAAGLEEVVRVCDAINKLHPTVNASTGLHVHVAYGKGTSWELFHLKALVYNWLVHEEALDLLVPAERRQSNNSYAQSLKFQDDDIGTQLCWAEMAGLHGVQGLELMASLAEPGTFHGHAATAARNALHSVQDTVKLIDMVCPLGHHYKLNLQSLTKHGTIEFRHPAGTWDGHEIAHYVLLYTWFVHNSKQLGYTRDWTTREEGDPLSFMANAMYAHDTQLQGWLYQRAGELGHASSSACDTEWRQGSSAGAPPLFTPSHHIQTLQGEVLLAV